MSKLIFDLDDLWDTYESLSLKGIVWDRQGVPISAAKLLELFKDIYTLDKLNERVSQLRGKFAVIVSLRDKCYLISDNIRSIPLYYVIDQLRDRIVVTSDTKCLSHLGEKIDNHSLSEFKSSGFVTGNRTLFNNIRQIEAAQVVEIDANNLSIKCTSYWSYSESSFSTKTYDELYSELKSVYSGVSERMMTYCKNRTILLPLSGGYDSRFLAVLLKKNGYKNVICFSYGRASCYEAKISRNIAQNLGFQWEFIEYTQELVKNYFDKADSEWNIFTRQSFNFASIPHISDFIAIGELLKREIINEDVVVMPGHSGDIFAGTHIPKDIDKIESDDEIVDYLRHKHFRFASAMINLDIIRKNYAIHSIIESFSWKERQAKFIVHSLSTYSHYNLDSYLPFWDKDLADFFKRVPSKYKNRTSWQKYNLRTNLYDRFAMDMFIEYNVDIKRSFFSNFIPRVVCKVLGICKRKDCLNYFSMKRFLAPNMPSSTHISIAVIKNTLSQFDSIISNR